MNKRSYHHYHHSYDVLMSKHHLNIPEIRKIHFFATSSLKMLIKNESSPLRKFEEEYFGASENQEQFLIQLLIIYIYCVFL